MNIQPPLLLSKREGTQIKVGNSNLFPKLSSQQTDGRFSITEYELLPHFPGPPPHKHKVFEHAWYVLEGELNVQLNNETSTITEGGFIFIPKRTVHAFSNKSDSVVSLLAIDTPGGFEKYYEDLQTAFADGKALDAETFRQIQFNYDTYPPDYLFE